MTDHTTSLALAVVRTHIQHRPSVEEGGAMVCCTVTAEALHIHSAQLVVDPVRNRVGLRAPCGCMASVELSSLIVGLSQMLANGDHSEDDTHQAEPVPKPDPKPIHTAADQAEPLPPGLVKH